MAGFGKARQGYYNRNPPLNVLELLKQKGVEPKKAATTKGGEYHSPCPGCGGNDRFHVWPEQNGGDGSFWCRQCGKGGDSITFLMKFEGLTYPQACERLNKPLQNDKYRTPKPPQAQSGKYTKTDWQPAVPVPPPDPWFLKAGSLVSWAHQKLLENKTQRRWLSARGIKKAMILKYKLGWNPGKDGRDLWRPREHWGLPTVLKKDGIKKKLWIPRGLVIPHLSGDQVHRIRIRRPSQDAPRYYVLPGSSMEQMLINPENRVFLIIESELDLIMIDQFVTYFRRRPGILSLGSSSIKPDVRALESLKKATIILNALDYDDAGSKSRKWWDDKFPQHERWPVPDGKDPGEAFQTGKDIKDWINAGLPKAWTSGLSLLGQREGEAKKISVENKKTNVEAPAEIIELAELLKKHQVSIYNSPKQTRIRESQKFVRENWKTSKRISELVYLTPDVLDYLGNHPETVITGDNIILP